MRFSTKLNFSILYVAHYILVHYKQIYRIDHTGMHKRIRVPFWIVTKSLKSGFEMCYTFSRLFTYISSHILFKRWSSATSSESVEKISAWRMIFFSCIIFYRKVSLTALNLLAGIEKNNLIVGLLTCKFLFNIILPVLNNSENLSMNCILL